MKNASMPHSYCVQWRSRYGLFLRLIASMLVVCFVSQDFAMAQSQSSTSSSDINLSNFSIPQNIGFAKDLKNAGSPELVINIKDVHDNYSAQESVVSILTNLAHNYSIKTIGVEGSFGDLDMSFLSAFPQKDALKQASRQLMKDGWLSAGEFFKVISDDPNVALYGLEDETLYRENLNTFKETMASKKENFKRVHALLTEIDALCLKTFSVDLTELNKNGVLAVSSEVKFSDRWKMVENLANRFKVPTQSYVNINRLLGCSRFEKGIDFKVANDEREALMDTLIKKLARADVEKLILEGVNYRLGRTSQGSFSSYLIQSAQKASVDLSVYPNLNAYAQYMMMYEDIDIEEMKSEIQDLEDKIRERLYRNDQEKKLYRARQSAQTLLDIFEIKLSTYGLKFYRDNADWFNRELFEDVLPLGALSRAELDPIFQELPRVMRFYELAEKRNEVLLSHLIKRMRENGQTVGCLVTGGFHSRGITQLLKDQQLSYIVILPRFSKDARRPYISILTNTTGSYREHLESQQANEAKILATAYLYGYSAATWINQNTAMSQTQLNELLNKESVLLQKQYQEAYQKQSKKMDASKVSADVSKDSVKNIANTDPKVPGQYLAAMSLLRGEPFSEKVQIFYNKQNDQILAVVNGVGIEFKISFKENETELTRLGQMHQGQKLEDVKQTYSIVEGRESVDTVKDSPQEASSESRKDDTFSGLSERVQSRLREEFAKTQDIEAQNAVIRKILGVDISQVKMLYGEQILELIDSLREQAVTQAQEGQGQSDSETPQGGSEAEVKEEVEGLAIAQKDIDTETGHLDEDDLDAVVSSSGEKTQTRRQTEQFKAEAQITQVLSQIAQSLGVQADQSGHYDFRGYLSRSGKVGRENARLLRDQEGRQTGIMYINESGYLVIIDNRFQADTVGRSRLSVYARDQFRAQHEIKELDLLIDWAQQEKIISPEYVADVTQRNKITSFQKLLSDWVSNSKTSTERAAKIDLYRKKSSEFHKQALFYEISLMTARGKHQEALKRLEEEKNEDLQFELSSRVLRHESSSFPRRIEKISKNLFALLDQYVRIANDLEMDVITKGVRRRALSEKITPIIQELSSIDKSWFSQDELMAISVWLKSLQSPTARQEMIAYDSTQLISQLQSALQNRKVRLASETITLTAVTAFEGRAKKALATFDGDLLVLSDLRFEAETLESQIQNSTSLSQANRMLISRRVKALRASLQAKHQSTRQEQEKRKPTLRLEQEQARQNRQAQSQAKKVTEKTRQDNLQTAFEAFKTAIEQNDEKMIYQNKKALDALWDLSISFDKNLSRQAESLLKAYQAKRDSKIRSDEYAKKTKRAIEEGQFESARVYLEGLRRVSSKDNDALIAELEDQIKKAQIRQKRRSTVWGRWGAWLQRNVLSVSERRRMASEFTDRLQMIDVDKSPQRVKQISVKDYQRAVVRLNEMKDSGLFLDEELQEFENALYLAAVRFREIQEKEFQRRQKEIETENLAKATLEQRILSRAQKIIDKMPASKKIALSIQDRQRIYNTAKELIETEEELASIKENELNALRQKSPTTSQSQQGAVLLQKRRERLGRVVSQVQDISDQLVIPWDVTQESIDERKQIIDKAQAELENWKGSYDENLWTENERVLVADAVNYASNAIEIAKRNTLKDEEQLRSEIRANELANERIQEDQRRTQEETQRQQQQELLRQQELQEKKRQARKDQQKTRYALLQERQLNENRLRQQTWLATQTQKSEAVATEDLTRGMVEPEVSSVESDAYSSLSERLNGSVAEKVEEWDGLDSQNNASLWQSVTTSAQSMRNHHLYQFEQALSQLLIEQENYTPEEAKALASSTRERVSAWDTADAQRDGAYLDTITATAEKSRAHYRHQFGVALFQILAQKAEEKRLSQTQQTIEQEKSDETPSLDTAFEASFDRALRERSERVDEVFVGVKISENQIRTRFRNLIALSAKTQTVALPFRRKDNSLSQQTISFLSAQAANLKWIQIDNNGNIVLNRNILQSASLEDIAADLKTLGLGGEVTAQEQELFILKTALVIRQSISMLEDSAERVVLSLTRNAQTLAAFDSANSTIQLDIDLISLQDTSDIHHHRSTLYTVILAARHENDHRSSSMAGLDEASEELSVLLGDFQWFRERTARNREAILAGIKVLRDKFEVEDYLTLLEALDEAQTQVEQTQKTTSQQDAETQTQAQLATQEPGILADQTDAEQTAQTQTEAPPSTGPPAGADEKSTTDQTKEQSQPTKSTQTSQASDSQTSEQSAQNTDGQKPETKTNEKAVSKRLTQKEIDEIRKGWDGRVSRKLELDGFYKVKLNRLSAAHTYLEIKRLEKLKKEGKAKFDDEQSLINLTEVFYGPRLKDLSAIFGKEFENKADVLIKDYFEKLQDLESMQESAGGESDSAKDSEKNSGKKVQKRADVNQSRYDEIKKEFEAKRQELAEFLGKAQHEGQTFLQYLQKEGLISSVATESEKYLDTQIEVLANYYTNLKKPKIAGLEQYFESSKRDKSSGVSDEAAYQQEAKEIVAGWKGQNGQRKKLISDLAKDAGFTIPEANMEDGLLAKYLRGGKLSDDQVQRFVTELKNLIAEMMKEPIDDSSEDEAEKRDKAEERVEKVMAVTQLLFEVGNYKDKNINAMYFNQELMLLTLLSGENAGVGTAGGKTVTNYLFHVMARLLYGSDYRGTLMTENTDAVKNYMDDKKIEAMSQIANFRLIRAPERNDKNFRETVLKAMRGEKVTFKDKSGQDIESEGVLILENMARVFMYLDAQVEAINGDRELLEAMKVHFVTLDEFHIFLTSRDSGIIAKDTKAGDISRTQRIKGIYDKLTDRSRGYSYAGARLNWKVREIRTQDDLDQLNRDLNDKSKEAVKEIVYYVHSGNVALTPALHDEVVSEFQSNVGEVQSVLRGILAKDKEQYTVILNDQNERVIVPWDIFGGAKRNSNFQDLAYQTAIALKEKDGDAEKANELVRQSVTSMQSALAESVKIKGATVVGDSGTLLGLEAMAKAQIGNQTRQISTSKLDSRRFSGILPSGDVEWVQGRRKGHIVNSSDDLFEEAMLSLKGADGRIARTIGFAISAKDTQDIKRFKERFVAEGFEVIVLDGNVDEADFKRITDNPQELDGKGNPRVIIMTERAWTGRDFGVWLDNNDEKIGIDLFVHNTQNISEMNLVQLMGRAGRSGAEGRTIRRFHMDTQSLSKSLLDLLDPQKRESFRALLMERYREAPDDMQRIMRLLGKLEVKGEQIRELLKAGLSREILAGILIKHGVSDPQQSVAADLLEMAANQSSKLSSFSAETLRTKLKTVDINTAQAILNDVRKTEDNAINKVLSEFKEFSKTSKEEIYTALENAGFKLPVGVDQKIADDLNDAIEKEAQKLGTKEVVTIDQLSNAIIDEILKKNGIDVAETDKVEWAIKSLKDSAFSMENLARVNVRYLDYSRVVSEGARFTIRDVAKSSLVLGAMKALAMDRKDMKMNGRFKWLPAWAEADFYINWMINKAKGADGKIDENSWWANAANVLKNLSFADRVSRQLAKLFESGSPYGNLLYDPSKQYSDYESLLTDIVTNSLKQRREALENLVSFTRDDENKIREQGDSVLALAGRGGVHAIYRFLNLRSTGHVLAEIEKLKELERKYMGGGVRQLVLEHKRRKIDELNEPEKKSQEKISFSDMHNHETDIEALVDKFVKTAISFAERDVMVSDQEGPGSRGEVRNAKAVLQTQDGKSFDVNLPKVSATKEGVVLSIANELKAGLLEEGRSVKIYIDHEGNLVIVDANAKDAESSGFKITVPPDDNIRRLFAGVKNLSLYGNISKDKDGKQEWHIQFQAPKGLTSATKVASFLSNYYMPNGYEGLRFVQAALGLTVLSGNLTLGQLTQRINKLQKFQKTQTDVAMMLGLSEDDTKTLSGNESLIALAKKSKRNLHDLTQLIVEHEHIPLSQLLENKPITEQTDFMELARRVTKHRGVAVSAHSVMKELQEKIASVDSLFKSDKTSLAYTDVDPEKLQLLKALGPSALKDALGKASDYSADDDIRELVIAFRLIRESMKEDEIRRRLHGVVSQETIEYMASLSKNKVIEATRARLAEAITVHIFSQTSYKMLLQKIEQKEQEKKKAQKIGGMTSEQKKERKEELLKKAQELIAQHKKEGIAEEKKAEINKDLEEISEEIDLLEKEKINTLIEKVQKEIDALELEKVNKKIASRTHLLTVLVNTQDPEDPIPNPEKEKRYQHLIAAAVTDDDEYLKELTLNAGERIDGKAQLRWNSMEWLYTFKDQIWKMFPRMPFIGKAKGYSKSYIEKQQLLRRLENNFFSVTGIKKAPRRKYFLGEHRDWLYRWLRWAGIRKGEDAGKIRNAIATGLAKIGIHAIPNQNIPLDLYRAMLIAVNAQEIKEAVTAKSLDDMVANIESILVDQSDYMDDQRLYIEQKIKGNIIANESWKSTLKSFLRNEKDNPIAAAVETRKGDDPEVLTALNDLYQTLEQKRHIIRLALLSRTHRELARYSAFDLFQQSALSLEDILGANHTPKKEETEKKAYEIWQEKGSPANQNDQDRAQDWAQAEKLLKKEQGRKFIREKMFRDTLYRIAQAKEKLHHHLLSFADDAAAKKYLALKAHQQGLGFDESAIAPDQLEEAKKILKKSVQIKAYQISKQTLSQDELKNYLDAERILLENAKADLSLLKEVILSSGLARSDISYLLASMGLLSVDISKKFQEQMTSSEKKEYIQALNGGKAEQKIWELLSSRINAQLDKLFGHDPAFHDQTKLSDIERLTLSGLSTGQLTATSYQDAAYEILKTLNQESANDVSLQPGTQAYLDKMNHQMNTYLLAHPQWNGQLQIELYTRAAEQMGWIATADNAQAATAIEFLTKALQNNPEEKLEKAIRKKLKDAFKRLADLQDPYQMGHRKLAYLQKALEVADEQSDRDKLNQEIILVTDRQIRLNQNIAKSLEAKRDLLQDDAKKYGLSVDTGSLRGLEGRIKRHQTLASMMRFVASKSAAELTLQGKGDALSDSYFLPEIEKEQLKQELRDLSKDLTQSVEYALSHRRVSDAVEFITPILVIGAEMGFVDLLDSLHADGALGLIADTFGKLYHTHHSPEIALVTGYTRDEQSASLQSLFYELHQRSSVIKKTDETKGNEHERIEHFRSIVKTQSTGKRHIFEQGLKKLNLKNQKDKASELPKDAKDLVTPFINDPENFSSYRNRIYNQLNREIAQIGKGLDRIIDQSTRLKMAHGLAMNIDQGSKTEEEIVRVIRDELKDLATLATGEISSKQMEDNDPRVLEAEKEARAAVEKLRRDLIEAYPGIEASLPPFLEPKIIYVDKDSVQSIPRLANASALYFEGAGVVVVPVDRRSKKAAPDLSMALITHEFLHAVAADFGNHDIREGIVSHLAAEIGLNAEGGQYGSHDPDEEGAQKQNGIYTRAKEGVVADILTHLKSLGVSQKRVQNLRLARILFTGSFKEAGVYGIAESIHALKASGMRDQDVVYVEGKPVSLEDLNAQFGVKMIAKKPGAPEDFPVRLFDHDSMDKTPIYVRLKKDATGRVHLTSTGKKPLDERLKKVGIDKDSSERQKAKMFIAQVLPHFFDLFDQGLATDFDAQEVTNAAASINAELADKVEKIIRLRRSEGNRADRNSLISAVMDLNNNYLGAMDLQINAEYDSRTNKVFVNGFEVVERQKKMITLESGERRVVDYLILADLDILDNKSRESAINRSEENHVSVFRNKSLEWVAKTLHPISSGSHSRLLLQLKKDLERIKKDSKLVEKDQVFMLDPYGQLQFVNIDKAIKDYPEATTLLSRLNQLVWQEPIYVGTFRYNSPTIVGGDDALKNQILRRMELVRVKLLKEIQAKEKLLLKDGSRFKDYQDASRLDPITIERDILEPALGVHELRHKRDDLNNIEYGNDITSREMLSHGESVYNPYNDPDLRGGEAFAVFQMLGYVEEGNAGFGYKRVGADFLAFMTSRSDRWQAKFSDKLGYLQKLFSIENIMSAAPVLGTLTAILYGINWYWKPVFLKTLYAYLSFPTTWLWGVVASSWLTIGLTLIIVPVAMVLGIFALEWAMDHWWLGTQKKLLKSDNKALIKVREQLANMSLEDIIRLAGERSKLFEKQLDAQRGKVQEKEQDRPYKLVSDISGPDSGGAPPNPPSPDEDNSPSDGTPSTPIAVPDDDDELEQRSVEGGVESVSSPAQEESHQETEPKLTPKADDAPNEQPELISARKEAKRKEAELIAQEIRSIKDFVFDAGIKDDTVIDEHSNVLQRLKVMRDKEPSLKDVYDKAKEQADIFEENANRLKKALGYIRSVNAQVAISDKDLSEVQSYKDELDREGEALLVDVRTEVASLYGEILAKHAQTRAIAVEYNRLKEIAYNMSSYFDEIDRRQKELDKLREDIKQANQLINQLNSIEDAIKNNRMALGPPGAPPTGYLTMSAKDRERFQKERDSIEQSILTLLGIDLFGGNRNDINRLYQSLVDALPAKEKQIQYLRIRDEGIQKAINEIGVLRPNLEAFKDANATNPMAPEAQLLINRLPAILSRAYQLGFVLPSGARLATQAELFAAVSVENIDSNAKREFKQMLKAQEGVVGARFAIYEGPKASESIDSFFAANSTDDEVKALIEIDGARFASVSEMFKFLRDKLAGLLSEIQKAKTQETIYDLFEGRTRANEISEFLAGRSDEQLEAIYRQVLDMEFKPIDWDKWLDGELSDVKVQSYNPASSAKEQVEETYVSRIAEATQEYLNESKALKNVNALPVSVLSVDGKTLDRAVASLLKRLPVTVLGQIYFYAGSEEEKAKINALLQSQGLALNIIAVQKGKDIVKALQALPDMKSRPVTLLADTTVFGQVDEAHKKQNSNNRFVIYSENESAKLKPSAVQKLALSLIAESKAEPILALGAAYQELQSRYPWLKLIELPLKVLDELKKVIANLRATASAA